MRVLREYWRNLTLVVLALGLVFLSYKMGLDAGMASGRIDPSWRYRFYAVPIVMSQLFYGRPYDYVGYHRLATPFQGPTPPIDTLIADLRSIDDVESQGLFFILADDKGSVDFVRLAFALYGITSSSFYYFYFTIVLASCLLYAVSYFRDREKLALLVLLCLAFYVAMSGFLAFPPGVNILDVHTFGMLSLPAFLHLVVAATDQRPTRPLGLLTTVAQALILIFVLHSRSSNVSQVASIVVGSPLIVYLSRRLTRSSAAVWPRLVPAAIVLIAFCLLPVYQRLTYHPDYFGRRATLLHVVFHNLIIGVSRNPTLAARYDLGGGDTDAAFAVEAYVKARAGANPARRNWTAAELNAVTTQGQFDFVEYEEAARDLYFSMWKEQPGQMLWTLLYWHPLDVYTVLKLHMGFSRHPSFDRRYIFNPLHPWPLLVLVATLLLCMQPLGVSTALIALLLLASALAVPILFYPGGFLIMAEVFVSAGLLVYVALGVALPRLWSRAVTRAGYVARPDAASAGES